MNVNIHKYQVLLILYLLLNDYNDYKPSRFINQFNN